MTLIMMCRGRSDAVHGARGTEPGETEGVDATTGGLPPRPPDRRPHQRRLRQGQTPRDRPSHHPLR